VATGSAHAARWSPDDTAVSGAAENPTFVYEGVEIFCEVGTFDGMTGNNSLTLIAWLTFDNCSFQGLFQAETIVLNEFGDTLTVDALFDATRTGAEFCGPPSGKIRFMPVYVVPHPANLTIEA
jgi:hypothetical protein